MTETTTSLSYSPPTPINFSDTQYRPRLGFSPVSAHHDVFLHPHVGEPYMDPHQHGWILPAQAAPVSAAEQSQAGSAQDNYWFTSEPTPIDEMELSRSPVQPNAYDPSTPIMQPETPVLALQRVLAAQPQPTPSTPLNVHGQLAVTVPITIPGVMDQMSPGAWQGSPESTSMSFPGAANMWSSPWQDGSSFVPPHLAGPSHPLHSYRSLPNFHSPILPSTPRRPRVQSVATLPPLSPTSKQYRWVASQASQGAVEHPTPTGREGEDESRKKRKRSIEDDRDKGKAPVKSMLHPPKQAPSTWQIFFTDQLQLYKSMYPGEKLNVAQAAKEAGIQYKSLSREQKEVFRQRARLAKEDYERQLTAWKRTLTPNDIKAENLFRTAQRKAGKSRKANLKDPNGPKKPLSAYFMFLQKIRSSPEMIQDVFGDETETTKQSILAAKKWRMLTDEQKQPFLAQAEKEKMEYEIARREYEDRMAGIDAISTSFPRPPYAPPDQTVYSNESPQNYLGVPHRDEGYGSDSADDTKAKHH